VVAALSPPARPAEPLGSGTRSALQTARHTSHGDHVVLGQDDQAFVKFTSWRTLLANVERVSSSDAAAKGKPGLLVCGAKFLQICSAMNVNVLARARSGYPDRYDVEG